MTTVLLYGDSNTHGSPPDDSPRFGREIRWPGHVARALPEVEVIAEGLPGRTTVHDDPIEGAHLNGFAVLPAILASHKPIDLVAILLGTNDFKARFSVTAFDVAASVERLARLVKASDAGPGGQAPRLLLIAPPPVVEVGRLAGMFAGGAAKSARLGAELATVAERLGAAYLDAAAHIAVSPRDGVHFEPEAHAVLGAAVAAAIRPLI